ncbi:GNAT family N-acetyltransferase [Alkalihalobacillus deserti]|uniref:GNAT family N-acetyltransferase n=1 Tax=Alkalihalobacillus deserti TaxID=2879466 RepID=UPI001D143957|nr:GNAT family protein [Alkalihalobacillus deserti]
MIVGEKVTLRALNQKDFEQILEWVNNPKLKYLTGTLYPVSEIEHETWFKNKILDNKGKIFGIQDKPNSQLIGIIGLKNMDFINRNTELYIYIGDENYWGKGLGTEATSLIAKFVFNELNFHRIYLSVFSYNERAISSYEKAGFKKEGVMKESLFKSGTYHDIVLMALINKG